MVQSLHINISLYHRICIESLIQHGQRYRIYRIYQWLTWEQIQRLYGTQASTMVQGAKKELGSNDEWWYEVLVEIH